MTRLLNVLLGVFIVMFFVGVGFACWGIWTDDERGYVGALLMFVGVIGGLIAAMTSDHLSFMKESRERDEKFKAEMTAWDERVKNAGKRNTPEKRIRVNGWIWEPSTEQWRVDVPVAKKETSSDPAEA